MDRQSSATDGVAHGRQETCGRPIKRCSLHCRAEPEAVMGHRLETDQFPVLAGASIFQSESCFTSSVRVGKAN